VADPVEAPERTSIPDGPPGSGPPPWLQGTITRSIWTAVGIVVLTLAAIWFASQARSLIRYLLISLFLALALEPAVNWFHEKRGWRRGSATGLLLAGLFLLFVVLGATVVPILVSGVNGIADSVPTYIRELNDFTQKNFHTTAVSAASTQQSEKAAETVTTYLKEHSGDVLGAVSGAVSAVFALFTIGLFTFYMTADAPKIRRAIFSRAPPDQQERLNWATKTAIEKMGGYLYSRALLALINGVLFFITLLAVGSPYAAPMAVFEGIVSEFIPIVGTYIAAAVPIVVVLAAKGPTAAIIVLVEVLIYQQIENYILSPRLSQKTIELNAGIAFGAALAGGSVGGFIGAFFALPIAAVVQAFISQYSKRYDVIETDLTKEVTPPPPREHKRRKRREPHDGETPAPEV
jgi:predicted PurR-regulated permease PerM